MPLQIGQQQILGGSCLFYNGGTANPNYYQAQLIITLNSQSIANNTSNITETLQVRSVNSGYWTWDNQTPTIQGIALAAASFDTRATNVWQTIGSRTFDVGHNSDGSLTLGASASFVTAATLAYSLKSGSVSGSVELNTIPRAALLNSFADFQIENTAGAINGNLTLYSTGFTHYIQLFKNGVERANWTIGTGNVGSYDYALTLTDAQRNAIFNDMPGSWQDTFTLYVSTWNGGTQIGSTQSRTAMGTIPVGYKPSITTANSNFSWINKNDPVALRGYLIQNVSTLTLLLSGGSVPTGTSLSMYQVRFGTVTRQGAYTGAAISENVGLIANSGTLYAYYSVKDSRGRWSDEISETLTVQAYNPPINSGFKVQRNGSVATSADYVLKFSDSLYALGNTWTYTPYYWTGAYWQACQAATAIAAASIDAVYTHALPYSESLVYNLKVVLTDLFNSVEYTDTLPTSAFPLSIGKKGCGFGKDTSDTFSIEVGPLGIDSDGPISGSQLKSDIAAGTPPLTVTSPTVVPNLNTDLHDGFHASQSIVGNNIVVRDANGYILGSYFNSSRGDEATAAASYLYDIGDGYMRKKTLANARIELGVHSWGSNANGYWIKYSNGMMIQHWAITTTYGTPNAWGGWFISDQIGWTFPIAFVNSAVVIAGTLMDGNLCVVAPESVSATGTIIRLCRGATLANGTSKYIDLTATGRWQ